MTTAELLGFRNAVNYGTPDKSKPIIIHCSAGVGRTGTYIAIDTLVKQALDMGGDLDVDKVISDMRQRRCYMVQSEMQYLFIYRCVLDCLSELLRDESAKVDANNSTAAEQEAFKAAAEAAERARKEEEAKEQAAIEEARRVSLELSVMLRENFVGPQTGELFHWVAARTFSSHLSAFVSLHAGNCRNCWHVKVQVPPTLRQWSR